MIIQSPQSATVPRLAQSFGLSLEAENKSKRTREGYLETLGLFARWLQSERLTERAGELTRAHIEGFLADLFARGRTASTVATRYKGLRQFFNWAVADGELDRSPMDGMRPPIIPEQPVPVITEDEMRRLLKACTGTNFEDRRDLAIVLLLADTGARRSECGNLTIDDVDLENRTVTVLGKGRRVRAVRFGAKTARAIDRYLRIRDAHALAATNALWLGSRSSTFSDQGIRQMLERRGAEANIERLHAHRFRHTFAHAHLASGGHEGDLMQLAGWKSRQMLNRYGQSVAAERARANYESPMDRL